MGCPAAPRHLAIPSQARLHRRNATYQPPLPTNDSDLAMPAALANQACRTIHRQGHSLTTPELTLLVARIFKFIQSSAPDQPFAMVHLKLPVNISGKRVSDDLDLVRGLAAVAVLVYHVRYRFFFDYAD